MRRGFVYALLIIAILLLAALAVFLSRGTSVEVTQDTSPAIAVSTSTIDEETDTYLIHADYPVSGIPALDAKIKGTVDAGIADLKSVEADPSSDIKNEFEGTFDSVYVGPDIISVRLILSEYTGGAHGNANAIGINYDKAKGTFLSLDDALAMTGQTLQQISNIADQQLTSEFDEVQFPDGIAPTPDNFSTFVIDEANVTFVLQEYQVEAYAAGMPEVSIPRIR